MKAFLYSANGQLSLGLILVAAVFVAFAGTVMMCAIFGASFVLAVVVLARQS